MMELKDWLGKEIARHDRMVDEYRDFPVDVQIYNLIAIQLRRVRDKVNELVKKENDAKRG